MRIFLYEWITGGGLVEHSGRLPASLLAEGAAMIQALAADFAALPGAEVAVLRDLRLDELELPGCEIVEVDSDSTWRSEFDRCAQAADWTMVVAPEFDGILVGTLARMEGHGARSLNAPLEFVRLAADKHATAERLAAHGVAAPVGRLLEADAAKMPADFPYPAVLKPASGAGSQHTLRIEGPGDEPEPYPWPRRLERFHAGRPASVSAICGPAGVALLPPCWQHISQDGRFTYRGGAIVGEAHLAARAHALAGQALAAMPPARGYVGVDLVLGDDPAGAEDVVVEINPRLTTSYVGLRAAVEGNLSQGIIDAAAGMPVTPPKLRAAVEFSASGAVWRALP
ncbi:MAG TPA: ATP-grasp domain-containing protein [Lacipirellulaceae bacterium]|nr:ATP-grasp domain-containing protein [Lacipirellulaceae bacterium]